MKKFRGNNMERTLLVNNLIKKKDLLDTFKGQVNVFLPKNIEKNLAEFDQVLVYDSPKYLPFWYEYLSKKGFEFRYHIVIYFNSDLKKHGLKISHVGLLHFYKSNLKISKLINKVRVPHQFCKYCGKTLKDWGGKKHLMHPEGSVVSDVWKHFNITEKDILNKGIPEIVLNLTKKVFGETEIIQGIREIKIDKNPNKENVKENPLPSIYRNVLINNDCLEELDNLPSNSIDMIFIDPPYNLGKDYKNYEDERDDYINWIINWLEGCFRVLKPKGSLFLLNIPKWQHEVLYRILDKYYIQDWIVWDNQAEPKGQLIPAHYPILWLSKTKDVKFYTLNEFQDDKDFCLRASCRRKRGKSNINDKVEVKNVRWDIHRVKHSHKRLDHPTQLPPKLLEFLINLTTKEGDIVLDPMMGIGTTPYVAKSLNRMYIGIDISDYYVKLADLRLKGLITFEKEKKKKKKKKYTQKEIQLKIGEFTLEKGYIPTLNEFCKEYKLDCNNIKTLFPNWSKATKYAKLIIETIKEKNNSKKSVYINV